MHRSFYYKRNKTRTTGPLQSNFSPNQREKASCNSRTAPPTSSGLFWCAVLHKMCSSEWTSCRLFVARNLWNVPWKKYLAQYRTWCQTMRKGGSRTATSLSTAELDMGRLYRWLGSGRIHCRVGHGLDWIGLDDCDPFLINNHCSTVDVSVKVWLMNVLLSPFYHD